MGIRGAHKLTDRIDHLDSNKLIIILDHLYRKKKNEGVLGPKPRSCPVVDLDASWIVRKMNCSNDARMGYLIRLSKILLRLGIDVNVICDGPIRHHSKRAKTRRDASHKENEIDYKALSLELMFIVNSYNEKKLILEKKVAITNKLEKLRKKLNVTRFDVGDVFYEKLCIEANVINNTHDTLNKITIQQNKFQADILLAYRCINNMSDICFTSDTDQAALCGAKCISVKEFTIGKNNDIINNISIFSGSINTIFEIANYIDLQHTDPNIKKATFAIFEGIKDVRVRGLISIGLGCDVYDIPILTPPKMYEWILSKQEVQSTDLFSPLLEHLISKCIVKRKVENNTKVRGESYKNMLSILVDTYIYEPIVMTKCSDPNIVLIEYECITYPLPNSFHYYIKEFNFDEDEYKNLEVENFEDIKQCVGPGIGTHLFLTGEGYILCSFCCHVICSYCRFEIQRSLYCVDCFQLQQGIDEDADPVSAETMLHELAQHGMQLNSTDSIESVLGIYNTTINDNMNVVYNREGLESRVRFPIENSNYIINLPIITSFDFDNGGIFIHDPKLSDRNIVEIMQIFSDLLVCSNARDINYQDDLYMLLPDLIIKFAQQSRVHFGYRLLKRTLRHVLEFAKFNVHCGTASVIKYNEKTGLLLQQKVRASMRSNIYDTQVIITKNEIVACACTCQSGGQNEERIVCVHVLPIIYKITMLLYNGLAEHLLVEFYGHLKARDMLTYNDLHLASLQESLLILKKITNSYTLEDDTKNLTDMLESFSVGTDRTKKFKLTKNPSAMIAFGNMDHRSLRKKVSDNFQPKTVEESTEPGVMICNTSTPVDIMKKETYVAIMKLISAIITKMKKKNTLLDDSFLYVNIGYKILSSRAELNFDTIKKAPPELNISIDTLFKNANTSMRQSKRRNVPSTSNIENDSNSVDEMDTDSRQSDETEIDETEIENDIGTVNESDNESVIPRQLLDSLNNTKSPIQHKTYYSCCVCGKTSTKYPHLIFRKLPITQQKSLQGNANDKVRFQHAKRIVREQLYYQRLKVRNKTSKQLRFCNEHEEEKEYLPVSFRNVKGILETKHGWILVPKDPTKESSRTRIDSQNRLSYERKRKAVTPKQSTRKKT